MFCFAIVFCCACLLRLFGMFLFCFTTVKGSERKLYTNESRRHQRRQESPISPTLAMIEHAKCRLCTSSRIQRKLHKRFSRRSQNCHLRTLWLHHLGPLSLWLHQHRGPGPLWLHQRQSRKPGFVMATPPQGAAKQHGANSTASNLREA